jgi:uncharacterized protein YifN (PemK superfamily)
MPNQPLPYNPHPKEVLRCDYSGLVDPEMDKVRWVVVITPRHLNIKKLCTVVPLSTTAPHDPQPWHVRLDADPYPKGTPGIAVWAKCDMVMRVSYSRLTAYWDAKVDGRRNYVNLWVSDDEYRRIKRGVVYALGLGSLAAHVQ